ncbi:MAG: hypothetical protein ABIR34_07955, partial [Marmoricola sp.]
LAAIDDPTLTWHEAIASAHTRPAPLMVDTGSDDEQVRIDSLLSRHDWQAANLISERDVGSITETDRAAAAEHAVVSTLLLEPLLLTLRRIALENASRRGRR